MTPPIEPLTSLGGGPPEEDRLLIRALRVEVRQALARLNTDDEGNDPARVRQVIRDCIEAHQRRAFSTTNTPRLIDPDAAERGLVADFLGFGALERYLRAPRVEEIGIVGPGRDWVWLTDGTKQQLAEIVCEDEAELVALIRRVVGSLGRSFTSKSPMVDATLPRWLAVARRAGHRLWWPIARGYHAHHQEISRPHPRDGRTGRPRHARLASW